MLVQSLTTDHKVGLGVVAALFIGFALVSAFVFPRFWPNFPGRGLPAFVIVCVLFFLGMMSAVETFGAEPKEKGAEHESTTEARPTTTETPSTTTVALPAPTTTAATTTTAKPTPKPQTVPVTETEFKITLPSTTLKAGDITFQVKNAGTIDHDLVITGNGVSAGTPRFPGGQTKTLKVNLKPGTYKLFCSVPGHEQAGMVQNITVTG